MAKPIEEVLPAKPNARVRIYAYAIRDAFKNKTEIALFALNDLKTVTGAEGPAGNFIISSFEREEGPGQVQFIDVEAKPSSFNSWYVAP